MPEQKIFKGSYSIWNAGNCRTVRNDRPIYIKATAGMSVELDPKVWDIEIIATKKALTLKAGDVIEDGSGLSDAVPGTGVVDREGDLWQKRTDEHWYVTYGSNFPYWNSLAADLGPLTVVYIPSKELE